MNPWIIFALLSFYGALWVIERLLKEISRKLSAIEYELSQLRKPGGLGY